MGAAGSRRRRSRRPPAPSATTPRPPPRRCATAGITVSLAPGRRRPDRRRRGARRPRVLGRPARPRARRWPPRSRAGAPAASRRPRSTSPASAARPSTRTTARRRSSARAPQLEATDLPPFEAAIEAGVPLVMVGHALYPALDAERIASQSQRDRRATCCAAQLGFRGRRRSPTRWRRRRRSRPADVATASERAVRAGADLVLLDRRAAPTAPVYRHLLAAGPQRRRRSRERVRESAARVLALKESGARSPYRAVNCANEGVVGAP